MQRLKRKNAIQKSIILNYWFNNYILSLLKAQMRTVSWLRSATKANSRTFAPHPVWRSTNKQIWTKPLKRKLLIAQLANNLNLWKSISERMSNCAVKPVSRLTNSPIMSTLPNVRSAKRILTSNATKSWSITTERPKGFARCPVKMCTLSRTGESCRAPGVRSKSTISIWLRSGPIRTCAKFTAVWTVSIILNQPVLLGKANFCVI